LLRPKSDDFGYTYLASPRSGETVALFRRELLIFLFIRVVSGGSLQLASCLRVFVRMLDRVLKPGRPNLTTWATPIQLQAYS